MRSRSVLVFVEAWASMGATDVALRSVYYSRLGELRDPQHWSEFLGTAMVVMPWPYLLAAAIFAACAAGTPSWRFDRSRVSATAVVSVPIAAGVLFLLGHLLWSRGSFAQDLADISRRGWASPGISLLALGIGALIIGAGSLQNGLQTKTPAR